MASAKQKRKKFKRTIFGKITVREGKKKIKKLCKTLALRLGLRHFQ